MKIDQLVDDVSNNVSATVIIAPKMMLYRTAVSEENLQIFGCKYSTKDQSKIEDIQNILRRSHVRPAPSPGRPIDLRVAIYLIASTGLQTKFLFEDDFDGHQPIAGITAGIDVLALETLPEDLRKWAARVGHEGSGDTC